MTDAQLDALESAARKVGEVVGCEERLQAECDYIAVSRPRRILGLIAELRQAQAERDWLAWQLDFENCCVPSDLKEEPGYCLEHECKECGLSSMNAWLEAAKDAVCPKN